MVRILFSILCLILMAAFIVAEYREKWVAGVALKGAASLCFVILGILGSRGAADARFAGFVVAGRMCSTRSPCGRAPRSRGSS